MAYIDLIFKTSDGCRILIINKITSEYFTVIRNIDTREKEMKTSLVIFKVTLQQYKREGRAGSKDFHRNEFMKKKIVNYSFSNNVRVEYIQ